MAIIPDFLVKSQSQTLDGRRWLERLPVLIDEISNQWELQSLQPIDANGSCSWVAKVTRHGEELVVKIGMPHMESRDEAKGLFLWQQSAADVSVSLLAEDDKRQAMLLESCVPGMPLKSLPELQQDEVVCSTLKQLWQVSTESALAVGIRDLGVMLDYWCKDTKLKYLESPYADYVEKGCLIYQSMHRSTVHKSLLVTDLHAGNILSSTRSPWLMIDPKPFVGDPAYDVTQHALNCQPRLMANPRALVVRLSVLSGCDAYRIAQWLAARLLTDDDLNNDKLACAYDLLSVTSDQWQV